MSKKITITSAFDISGSNPENEKRMERIIGQLRDNLKSAKTDKDALCVIELAKNEIGELF